MTSKADVVTWYLEGFVDSDKVPRRYPVRSCPFVIGRRQDLDVHLPVAEISGLHAELFLRDGRLHVRDLQSTNGTFVNGERVADYAPLEAGDLLHFAHSEFVLRAAQEDEPEDEKTVISAVRTEALPQRTVHGAAQFRELMQREAVACVFQPIVSLHGVPATHYESLGRGALDGLPTAPLDLFRIAETLGREVDLSTLLRSHGVRDGSRLPGGTKLFVNTHAKELHNPALAMSLAAIRQSFPEQPVIVEVSEATVTGPADMRRLKVELEALDMGLAYDDFGAGQARLLEFVEVPPDYLKFDISLVRGIHQASQAKQKLLQNLIEVAHDIGIACVAEGIEEYGELDFCDSAGFDFAQGFLLGRPAAVEHWLTSDVHVA